MTRLPHSSRLPKAAFEDARLAKYNLVSNLPDPLPVTDWELELLETELSDFIEELLTQAR